MSTLLTRRAVPLAVQRSRSVYNTFVAPTLTTDAILVETPDFTADMTVLMRDFTRNDLSPMPHRWVASWPRCRSPRNSAATAWRGRHVPAAVPRIVRLFKAAATR